MDISAYISPLSFKQPYNGHYSPLVPKQFRQGPIIEFALQWSATSYRNFSWPPFSPIQSPMYQTNAPSMTSLTVYMIQRPPWIPSRKMPHFFLRRYFSENASFLRKREPRWNLYLQAVVKFTETNAIRPGLCGGLLLSVIKDLVLCGGPTLVA